MKDPNYKKEYLTVDNGQLIQLGSNILSKNIRLQYEKGNTIFKKATSRLVYKGVEIVHWYELIVPGRWRPMKEKPKLIQMMELVGAD